eukprot:jgi/Chlat1/5639/Chrsp369S00865
MVKGKQRGSAQDRRRSDVASPAMSATTTTPTTPVPAATAAAEQLPCAVELHGQAVDAVVSSVVQEFKAGGLKAWLHPDTLAAAGLASGQLAAVAVPNQPAPTVLQVFAAPQLASGSVRLPTAIWGVCTGMAVKVYPLSVGEESTDREWVSAEVHNCAALTLRLRQDSPPTPQSTGSKGGSAHRRRSGVRMTLQQALHEGSDRQQSLLQSMSQRWLSGQYLVQGSVFVMTLLSEDHAFLVESAVPSTSDGDSQEPPMPTAPTSVLQVYLVDGDTTVKIKPPFDEQHHNKDSTPQSKATAIENENDSQSAAALAARTDLIGYSELGGLQQQIAALKELVQLPLQRPEITSEYYGESETALQEIFAAAASAAPALRHMTHSLTAEHCQIRQGLAKSTHGYVGADLTALCSEAAMAALRRYVSCAKPRTTAVAALQAEFNALSVQEDATSPQPSTSESLCVTHEDFVVALRRVRPSAMREVSLEVPSVSWSDIGGNDDVKQRLQELVTWPQLHSDAFERVGAAPPGGVLLYGPPGCSKTMLARAVASASGLNFIAIKGPELLSKWVGESEKAVQMLFARARAAAPSIVFFDEIDGLATSRSRHGAAGGDSGVGDRVITQLLTELDGFHARAGVVIIAATNRPDLVDKALLRPGRLDRLLYVPPPDEKARAQIFAVHLRSTPHAEDVSLQELASATPGYTGADIAAVCREAALAALEEDLSAQCVQRKHFLQALTTVAPSKRTFNEEFYLKYQRGGAV